MADINGTPWRVDETLIGTDGDDMMNGLGGSDDFFPRGGDDFIWLGNGAGGDGADRVFYSVDTDQDFDTVYQFDVMQDQLVYNQNNGTVSLVGIEDNGWGVTLEFQDRNGDGNFIRLGGISASDLTIENFSGFDGVSASDFIF